MRIYICAFTLLSTVVRVSLSQPTWIMSGSRNISRTMQLSHPITQPFINNDYIHVTPSNRSRLLITDTPDDSWPYLPYPGFWTCPRNTALSPNTEDCFHIIKDVFRTYGNMTVDLPADRCIRASYRSCLMYTCASSCEGFRWDMTQWYELAMHLQRSCIWGRGAGGYVQSQPGGRGEQFAYRTGLTHIDQADALTTPAIVC